MKHKKVASLEIIPTSPFDFDSTFYKPGHFPTSDTKWEPGKRWQTMLWENRRVGLIFQGGGSSQNPKVNVRVFSEKTLSNNYIESLKNEIIWRFNLDLDLSGFYKDLANDLQLKTPIKSFRGLRPMHAGSLYEYLIIAIVLQNATVKRSIYMMQTLFEKYGILLEFNHQKFWSFWKPEVLANTNEKELRNLKMGYRAKSLIRVSIPFAKKEIDEFQLRTQTVEEQKNVLISLYGIGPASVGYIMFDVFHNWNFLEHISPWEQKIYTKLFFNKNYDKELVPVSEMLKYFEKWGKWKNLAIHYIWEDLWWKRKNKHIPWLEKLIRI